MLDFFKKFLSKIITNRTSQGIGFFSKIRLLSVFTTSHGTMANFILSNCKIDINPGTREIKNTIFFKSVFVKQNFSDMTINNCQFEECSFAACSFDDVEFHKTIFINCWISKPKFEKTYLDPDNIRFNFREWKIGASNINTTLFQRLESNLRDLHQEDFSKGAHIQFQRYKRWQSRYESRKSTLIHKFGHWKDYTKNLAYDIFLLYGYGLYRAVFFTIILISLFAIGLDYYWDEISLASNVSNLEIKNSDVFQKVYFLIVTATTLGYGDITPKTSFGMGFVITLLVFSVIWTATLTALIVKRLVK